MVKPPLEFAVSFDQWPDETYQAVCYSSAPVQIRLLILTLYSLGMRPRRLLLRKHPIPGLSANHHNTACAQPEGSRLFLSHAYMGWLFFGSWRSRRLCMRQTSSLSCSLSPFRVLGFNPLEPWQCFCFCKQSCRRCIFMLYIV